MKRLFATLVLLAATVAAFAQPQSDFEPVLLPVSLAQAIPGAFGSVWATDFWLMAVGGNVTVGATELCGACSSQVLMGSNDTLHNSFGNFPDETPGELIYIKRDTAANARFNLRIRDLSRQSQTWGTEVPVVRESQFRTVAITLLGVPVDPRFRVTLRAYDPDVHQHASFRFDFRDMRTGAILASRTVAAAYEQSGHFAFPRVAACAQIGDLRAAVPEIASVESVRIEVVPADEATRFWSLASVTNNETQHVTLITPQQQP